MTNLDLFESDNSDAALQQVHQRDDRVSGFFGPYRFLSNFWDAPVTLDGVTYPSVENAYQAAKTVAAHREQFVHCTPGQAKRLGRGVPMRRDWDAVKLEVMGELVRQKFAPGSALSMQLLATAGLNLVEDNTWGDRFWGQCKGAGHNHLGRLLMGVREKLPAPEHVQVPEHTVAPPTLPLAPLTKPKFRFRGS